MAGVERERADVAKWLGLLMITLTVWQCVPRLSPSLSLASPGPQPVCTRCIRTRRYRINLNLFHGMCGSMLMMPPFRALL